MQFQSARKRRHTFAVTPNSQLGQTLHPQRATRHYVAFEVVRDGRSQGLKSRQTLVAVDKVNGIAGALARAAQATDSVLEVNERVREVRHMPAEIARDSRLRLALAGLQYSSCQQKLTAGALRAVA